MFVLVFITFSFYDRVEEFELATVSIKATVAENHAAVTVNAKFPCDNTEIMSLSHTTRRGMTSVHFSPILVFIVAQKQVLLQHLCGFDDKKVKFSSFLFISTRCSYCFKMVTLGREMRAGMITNK